MFSSVIRMHRTAFHKDCRCKDEGKKVITRTISSAFPKDSTIDLCAGTPQVYSQSPLMIRYQMPESEPLSEYSEIPMTLTRLVTTPLQKITPFMGQMQSYRMMLNNVGVDHLSTQVNHSKKDIKSDNVLYHEINNIPYNKPSSSQILPPSPHTITTHYKPDQTFIMQTTLSSLNTKNQKDENKIDKFGPVLAKTTDFSRDKTSSRNKLTLMSHNRFFIGSIDQVVRWHKMANKAQFHCIYEVPAILDSISCSPSGVWRMVLRSEQSSNTLPLQAVFYPIDRDLPKIQTGDLIICVGCMVGTNKLQVYNMWRAEPESLAGLKRTSFLCQRTLQESHAAPEP